MSAQVLGQRVGVDDVRGLDAVQDQVHDRNHVGQRLLLLAVEGALLQCLEVARRQVGLGLEVIEGFAQEARRPAGAVVDALADRGLDDLDHRADQRARGVILAAVAPGIAHALDLLFVERRQLMLGDLGAELQFVDVVDDLAQVVAAVNLVLDLAENLADLVLDGVRPGGPLLEAVQVGKELAVDEVAQVVAGQRTVVVELAVGALGGGPAFPAVGFFEDVAVGAAFERRFGGLVLLQSVQVLEEEQPGGLFGVIEFGGATRLFPEGVVDILEGLLKHCSCSLAMTKGNDASKRRALRRRSTGA